MAFVNHRGITPILIGRSAIQLFAYFVSFHSMTLNLLYLRNVSVTKFMRSKIKTSSLLIVQLKLKCLLKKPTHDDIIKANEFYMQLSFERYKGELVLRF